MWLRLRDRQEAVLLANPPTTMRLIVCNRQYTINIVYFYSIVIKYRRHVWNLVDNIDMAAVSFFISRMALLVALTNEKR